jgi:positive regulator of sigma E activity
MMWLKEAFVVDILPEGKYKVFFLEHAACKNCGACKAWGGEKDKTAVVTTEVENIKKGDMCLVGLEQEKLFKMAFFIYLTPLLIFFLLLGSSLLWDKINGVVLHSGRAFFIAAAGLVVSFVIALKFFDKRFRSGEWGMRIVKKIEGGKNAC